MSKGLRFFAASLIGLVFALGGSATAFAASISDVQITAASYNPRTDAAMVTAVVSCSETMDVRVFSVIYQPRGNQQASYAGGTEITCSTTPTTVVLENTELLDSARLRPGIGHVNVFVESIASPGDTFRGESADLRIEVARP